MSANTTNEAVESAEEMLAADQINRFLAALTESNQDKDLIEDLEMTHREGEPVIVAGCYCENLPRSPGNVGAYKLVDEVSDLASDFAGEGDGARSTVFYSGPEGFFELALSLPGYCDDEADGSTSCVLFYPKSSEALFRAAIVSARRARLDEALAVLKREMGSLNQIGLAVEPEDIVEELRKVA